ncbi:hypothetical protein E2986_11637, partial [Frieseomelitta varia]
AVTTTSDCTIDHDATIQTKPYEDIPGPKPIPILGNTWRLFPIIGQYQISDVAKLSQIFYDEYGKIVRLTGLIGRPDLLFVYDADEIKKIYRQEGPTPFRPSMPCLVHYKSVVRKDFFGTLPGVVGVYVIGCNIQDILLLKRLNYICRLYARRAMEKISYKSPETCSTTADGEEIHSTY